MSDHDDLDRAMPLVVEFESCNFWFGEVTVEVTLPEAGELELKFSPGDDAESEILQLIGRLVNRHLRELGGRELVIVRSEQQDSDEEWAEDDE